VALGRVMGLMRRKREKTEENWKKIKAPRRTERPTRPDAVPSAAARRRRSERGTKRINSRQRARGPYTRQGLGLVRLMLGRTSSTPGRPAPPGARRWRPPGSFPFMLRKVHLVCGGNDNRRPDGSRRKGGFKHYVQRDDGSFGTNLTAAEWRRTTARRPSRSRTSQSRRRRPRAVMWSAPGP